MGSRGNRRERGNTEAYSYEQTKAVARNLGLDIQTETATDLLALCPFHDNRRTPSFAINATTGAYYCFNPDCGSKGHSLVDLVRRISNKTESEAKRYVEKKGSEVNVNLTNELDRIFNRDDRMPYFPQMKIDELKGGLWESAEALDYMYGRGFNNKTLHFFDVGYSDKRKMVVTPVHDHEGSPVGVVGRGIEGKRHHNSPGMKKKEVLFNLHNAKKHSQVVVTESQFDSMRVHQAGFPNTVALLGSNPSKTQYALLDRFFQRVIIMTDSDKAGRKAGRNISAALKHKDILWAVHELGKVYPDGAKDAGDLEDEQIKHCIDNAISDFQYWAYKEL